MKKLIAVIMGGLSGEREISFLTGKACCKALKKKGYKVKEIDAQGPFVNKLKKIRPKVIFNALHGTFGEDGFVQSIFECLKIPYTHSGVVSSSLAMDKELYRIIFKKNKIRVPKYFSLHVGSENNLIFISATFQGTKDSKENIKKKIDELTQRKKKDQPSKIKTCGSTFKNPESNKAWKLIQNAGCADMNFGEAYISEKHCNFFVNKGNAKSKDLENLINQVKGKVLDKTGISLQLEIQIIGEKS